MQTGAYSLTVLLSYLVGSFPAGYLAGRARGIDIRTAGSGNIGATNVMRVLGRTAGISVFLVDGLKGFAAARWVPMLVVPHLAAASRENFALVAGAGAVIGHLYPCWLKFKGGKGIATTAGVGLAWAPAAFAAGTVVWAALFLATKYVSVASIAAAFVLPLAVWAFGGGPKTTSVIAVLSALAIYKHKANIARLIAGTENRAGSPKPPLPP